MRLALPLVAALALAAGCASSDPAARGPNARPSAASVAALSDSLAASGPGRRAVLTRTLARYGLTPFGDFGRREGANPRYAVDVPGPVVGGLVPGRYPLARDELVVVGTRADGPAVAAVLEAARVLAQRSQWAVVPERTVMVALWSGPDGLDQALAAGVWPRANVRAALVVGDAAPAPDSVAVTRIDVPAGLGATPAGAASGVALAQRVYDEVVRLAAVEQGGAGLGAPSDTPR